MNKEFRISLLRSLIMGLICYIGIVISSCNNKNTDNSNSFMTQSQVSSVRYFKALKEKSKDLDQLISDFYFNPDDVEKSEYNLIHRSVLSAMNEAILNEKHEVHWNESILEFALYDWAYDTTNCAENVLLFVPNGLDSSEYYCGCFNNLGKIVSTLPLYDPNINAIVWIR